MREAAADDDYKKNKELFIEEYKSCRDLIAKNIEIIEKAELYGAGALAGIVTFACSLGSKAPAALTWTPVPIALFGLYRFWAVDSTIDIINKYMVEVESEHPPLKWTTLYKIETEKTCPKKRLKLARYAIWIVLTALSFAFGLYAQLHGLPNVKAA